MSKILIGTQVWRGNKTLDFTKLNFDFLEMDLETFTPEEITSLKLPENFAFHAPHSIKFSHLYKNLENTMLAELERVVEFASNKEAKYVNFHFKFPVYGLKDLDAILKERAKKNVLKLLGKKVKCEITFENIIDETFSSEEIFSFLISNGAKLCLDTGHLAVQIFRKEKTLANYYKYLEKFLEKFGENIFVVHLHNVSFNIEGALIDHTLNGFIDLLRVIDILTSCSFKYLVIEVFSLDSERIPFDYKILENFAEMVRKRI